MTIEADELDDVCQFTYVGPIITDNIPLNADIDKRFVKAVGTLARLKARAWTSSKLSVKTNMTVYNVHVTSTLLYDSETCREKRLNTFHTRSIRVSWAYHGNTKHPTLILCPIAC